MKPLIIFDLDGTLAETAEDILNAVNHVTYPLLGMAPLNMREHRSLVSLGGRNLLKRAYQEAGRTLMTDDLEPLFKAFIAHYEDNIAVCSALFPGVRQALRRLESRGFELAICTNKSSGPCHALLQALDIAQHFPTIVANDTFPWSKPDGRVLTATIEKAGADPNRSIMVGDSRPDIDAARSAKMPVIAVDFGYSDVAVDELAPDRIISAFDGLDGAIDELLAH